MRFNEAAANRCGIRASVRREDADGAGFNEAAANRCGIRKKTRFSAEGYKLLQ